MSYQIVQFEESEGGKLAIIHDTWLTPRKTETYWPPVKLQSAYDKILAKGGEACVHPNKWTLYKIHRIFTSCDNLIEAKRKLAIAEDQSDLQTTDSEENLNLKRTVKKPLRYVIAEDSSESEDYYPHSSTKKLPRPPKPTSSLNDLSKSRKTIDISETEFQTNQDSTFTKENIGNYSKTASTLESQPIHNNTTASPASSFMSRSPSICTTRARFSHPNVLADDSHSKLIHFLSKIVEQNEEILQILKQKSFSNSNYVNRCPKLPVELPLQGFENLDVLEIYLQKPENQHSFVYRSRKVNTATNVERYNRIMKRKNMRHDLRNTNEMIDIQVETASETSNIISISKEVSCQTSLNYNEFEYFPFVFECSFNNQSNEISTQA
ncbi:hypothetical protein FQR65_LT15741 [Abscondita terminalis]|nr:hypothetical protein FQR65_LT15741 [Abscondita terminalis]